MMGRVAPNPVRRSRDRLALAAALLLAGLLGALVSTPGEFGVPVAEAQGTTTITASSITKTSVVLTVQSNWTTTACNSPVYRYRIQYKPSGQSNYIYWHVGTENSATKSNLSPNVSYIFLGRKEGGCSGTYTNGPWASVTATTLADLPAQVSGLILTSGSRTQLSILWSAPASNYTITGYDIEHRENTGSATETWTQAEVAGTSTSYTITGLDPGTNYEIRVRAVVTSQGDGAWSETLFQQTDPDLFATQAPDEFRLREMPSSGQTIVVSLTWKEVDEATGYQVKRTGGGAVAVYDTTETNLENTYDNSNDRNGRLAYIVRAVRTVNSVDTYSPWSPEETLLFYGSGQVAAPASLAAELAGARTPEPEVQELRDSVTGAVEELSEPTGFEVNTGAFLDLLGLLPGLIIFGLAFYTGWQRGQSALGFGVGYALLTLSLFIAAALLGFPIVWPILLTVFSFAVGGIGMGKAFGWL